MAYELLVIGVSAGSIEVLKLLFANLRKPIGIPIIILQHLKPDSKSYLGEIISRESGMVCFEAEDKMVLENNKIYIPAPNYHLLMEKTWTLSLSVEKKVCYARPSIDVLFESAADAVRKNLIGIILTGANSDGANGLKVIKALGGYTIVQEPKEAYATTMPLAAIREAKPNEILNIKAIAEKINELTLV